MIFIFGVLIVIAVMNTGEDAEKVVEKINGVAENYLERQEETAETFAILAYILAGISLLGLWASFKQKTLSSLISIGAMIFYSMMLLFVKQTGSTEGEIRYIEIRSSTSVPPTDYNNAEKDD